MHPFLALTSWPALGAFLLLLSTPSTMVAQAPSTASKTNLAAKAQLVATNLPPSPQSVFAIPQTAQDGRDPFFPHSARWSAAPNAGAASTEQTGASASVNDLHLNGISGLPEKRFAIINNRTFAVGDEGSVWAGANRLKIRCVAIGENSATIEVGTEKHELHFRSEP